MLEAIQKLCQNMTPAPLRLWLVVKNSTPTPLLLSKFIKTPAGFHSYNPAPVQNWYYMTRDLEGWHGHALDSVEYLFLVGSYYWIRDRSRR